MRSLTRKAQDQDPEPEKEIELGSDTAVVKGKPEMMNSPQILPDSASTSSRSTLERTETAYEGNPYDIDHVNTHNSAITQHSRRVKESRWKVFSFGRD